MSVKLHIGNAGHQLDDIVDDVKKAFNLAKKEATKLFDASGIDVFAFQSEFGTIPELGFGGFTASQHTIFCYLSAQLKEVDVKLLSSILLHEMQHAKRYGSVGYGDTLGEAMITEGLACLLEEEYTLKKPIYANAQVDSKTLSKAKTELYAQDYDHDAWFYGMGDLPRWAGYSIGYQLCKEYASKTGKTSSELSDLRADKILSNFKG